MMMLMMMMASLLLLLLLPEPVVLQMAFEALALLQAQQQMSSDLEVGVEPEQLEQTVAAAAVVDCLPVSLAASYFRPCFCWHSFRFYRNYKFKINKKPNQKENIKKKKKKNKRVKEFSKKQPLGLSIQL